MVLLYWPAINGPHLWQVGNSPAAQNGNFKNFAQQYKDFLLREKRIRGMHLAIKPTAIVPTINFAWKRSFAKVENNKKAILERGWYPANKNLLTRAEVLRTKKVEPDGNLTITQAHSADGTTTTGNTVEASMCINTQKNHQEAMQRKKEQKLLAEATKDLEQATRKLTSGVVFFNDMVALHGEGVWNHQSKWASEKKAKERNKQLAAKKAFLTKKNKCDEIQKRPSETWTVDQVNAILTYKRQKMTSPLKEISKSIAHVGRVQSLE
jgi:hypothetical protein